MYNITHIFKIDNTSYAFDYKNVFFLEMDNETEKELSLLIKRNVKVETPKTLLEALINNGYFLSESHSNCLPTMSQSNVLNISFAPIHNCNLSCSYCYASGGKSVDCYNEKFDYKKIDTLIEYIFFKKYYFFSEYKFDFVSGGEPLLSPDILEYFFKKIRLVEKQLNKKTTILLVTNGTLLTNENIELLNEYGVYLGISIDGPQNVHDNHRKYKNGKGSYDDVVNGIKRLKESNISSVTKDAWAMTVIANDSGSLIDIMENCIELGFKRMQMQLLRVSSSHKLQFSNFDIEQLKNNYKALFEHILFYAKINDLSRLKMICNDNDSFGKYIKRLLLRNHVFYRCFAGKNKISITARGEIFPCDSFCNNSEFCLGSIYSLDINTDEQRNFEHAHVYNRNSCRDCWCATICGGDCYYNSYIKNGDILTPDQFFCTMTKFFIENAIKMLLELQTLDSNNIKYLSQFFRIL